MNHPTNDGDIRVKTCQFDLRDATLADSETLLRWRNDAETRMASRDQGIVEVEQHEIWLRESLNNSNCKILIAEEDGVPVGTVRLDEGNELELSWTVCPTARGRGIGKQIVQKVVNQLKGTVVAFIRSDNLASQSIAKSAGFRLVDNDAPMLKFARGHY